jgi:endo-1,4-beta-D-glucanase Y
MNRFSGRYFYDADTEFGAVKKKVVPPPKTKPINTFGQRIGILGQSRNIEDRRTFTPVLGGARIVQVFGYLTWNTWYHLASRVNQNIANALQSRGFSVDWVSSNARNKQNSQYNFEIKLRVYNKYTTRQATTSLVNALAQTVALPNSIRITNVFDYIDDFS